MSIKFGDCANCDTYGKWENDDCLVPCSNCLRAAEWMWKGNFCLGIDYKGDIYTPSDFLENCINIFYYNRNLDLDYIGQKLIPQKLRNEFQSYANRIEESCSDCGVHTNIERVSTPRLNEPNTVDFCNKCQKLYCIDCMREHILVCDD